MLTSAPPLPHACPVVPRRTATAALTLCGDQWRLTIADPAETEPVITGPWPDGRSLRDPAVLAAQLSTALQPRGWWTAPGCNWPRKFPAPDRFTVTLRRTSTGWRRDQAEAVLEEAGLDYHGAHEPYMAAVAATLTAAGFTVTGWEADTGEPREGVITVAAGADHLALSWSDTAGWHARTPGPDLAVFGPQARALRASGAPLPLAAEPARVVTAAARLLGRTPVLNAADWTPPPDYCPFAAPPPDEPWDASPDLEAALAVYVTHPAWNPA